MVIFFIRVDDILCHFCVILQLQLKEKDHACRIAEDELLRIRKVRRNTCMNVGLYAVNMVNTIASQNLMFYGLRM